MEFTFSETGKLLNCVSVSFVSLHQCAYFPSDTDFNVKRGSAIAIHLILMADL